MSATPRVTRAEDTPEELRSAASVHFRRGVDLYQEGAYRAALIEMMRANELAPDYHVLFNIGQAHYALGEYVEAVRALDAYLAQGGVQIAQSRREEVESSLLELSKRVATLRITVDRANASVAVDGVEVGTAPLPDPVAVSLGRHRVSASTAEGATASATVDVAGGDQRTVALQLIAERTQAAPAPVAAPRQMSFWGGLSRRGRWGVGLLSTGVAVAIGGGVMAAMAKHADSDYDDALRIRPGNRATIASAHDDLQRNAVIADVLFGTALAAGVTGLVLVLVEHSAEARQSAVQLQVGLNSLLATGRF